VVHVFVLLVYLGLGDARVLESGDMYFRTLATCNWYAREIVRRYGHTTNADDYGVAYCVPRLVDTDKVQVYD